MSENWDVVSYSRRTVFQAINVERKYQNIKWGDKPHTVAEWLLIMRSELDEAERGWVKNGGDVRALEEVLQTVAVGVACLEQHGVYHQTSHATAIIAANQEEKSK